MTTQIPSALIEDGAITPDKLADSAVQTAKLADDAVITAKILDDSVTTDKIVDGALSADANGRAKMQDGFLSADATGRAKMADAFVNTAKLAEPRTAVTAVATTSGTEVNLSTSIPSWVTRVHVVLSGVSTSGVSALLLQLGTGGAFTTAGYQGSTVRFTAGGLTSTTTGGAGIDLTGVSVAAAGYSGVITLVKVGGNDAWLAAGTLVWSTTNYQSTIAGLISLAGTLDRIRLTTAGGADTFDSGQAGITYD